ncbi:23619_t:CDS:2, partial [Cetraspora pellucida]
QPTTDTINEIREVFNLYFVELPSKTNAKSDIDEVTHQKKFPTLASIAKDYMSIQATSVACEQAFSVVTNIISKIQNRLYPETSRASLCAKSWIDNEIEILGVLKPQP